MRCFLVFSALCHLSLSAVGGEFTNIVSSCTTIELEKASVSAVCKARNGADYKTALRLRGISNYTGVLTQEKDSSVASRFHDTCRSLSVDDYGILSGKCKDDSGKYKMSTFDLTTIIKNYNGSLVYP